MPPRTLLVVHGLPPGHVGGAELVTWRIARLLGQGGADVAILHADAALDAQPGVTSRTDAGGVARYGVGIRHGLDDWPATAGALSRVLGLWNPDVVWFHHLSGLTLGMPELLVAERIPYAVTLHDYWWMCARGQLVDATGERCPGPAAERCPACLAPGAPLPFRPLARRLASRSWRERQRRTQRLLIHASVRTAPTRHVGRRHEAWLPDAPVELLGNPPTSIGPVPLPPASGPLRIGYFGSLLPTKGIETLVTAFAKLPAGHASLDLFGPLPVGAGWRGWRQRVRQLAASCGVRLRGPYPPAEVASRLAEVEVVCLPSEWEENAPVVLAEAWAAGRAVVASDIGGIPELLNDRESAILVPAGDAAAWAAALSDADELRQAARRALASAKRAATSLAQATEEATTMVSRIGSR